MFHAFIAAKLVQIFTEYARWQKFYHLGKNVFTLIYGFFTKNQIIPIQIATELKTYNSLVNQ